MTDNTHETTTDSSQVTPQLAHFETALGELENLVEALETGDLSLEQALAKFERGVVLTRQCQDLLKHAELRVDQLLADSDETQPLATGPLLSEQDMDD